MTSLVPSSSAAHGITYSQNVARDVAERIDAMRAATGRSRISAWLTVLTPVAVTAGFAVTSLWPVAFMTGYLGMILLPIGPVIHHYRKKAQQFADLLDRERDAAWVSRKDGLVFFSDEGLFIEKRGGFKPYGVGVRRFTHVEKRGGKLLLHGMDRRTGATWTLDVVVPDGWTDADTQRVADKVAAFSSG